MTEQLREAFERAQQLPEHVQNYLAKRLLEEIEEREWEQIVSKPHARAAVRTLAEEAFREYQLGETEEGGFAVE
jgi:hypothetical protein